MCAAIFFSDDPKKAPQPVPLPGDVPRAFMDACREVTWRAECSDCHVAVTSRADAQKHIHRKHMVVARADSSPVGGGGATGGCWRCHVCD